MVARYEFERTSLIVLATVEQKIINYNLNWKYVIFFSLCRYIILFLTISFPQQKSFNSPTIFNLCYIVSGFFLKRQIFALFSPGIEYFLLLFRGCIVLDHQSGFRV